MLSVALSVLVVVLIGCSLMVGHQIRTQRRRARNRRHFEKDEPLEGGVADLD